MLLEDRVGQPTTEAEAERLALELYGLHVAAKALPGEYDDNFHLKTRPAGASGKPQPALVSPLTSIPELEAVESKLGHAAEHLADVNDADATETSAVFDADAEVLDEAPDKHSEEVLDTGTAEASAPETTWLPPAGTDFVLKVMHPARGSSLIDLQASALQHLAQRAPQVGLPRVCLNQNGEAFSAITAPDGSTRLVWLLTYIPGHVDGARESAFGGNAAEPRRIAGRVEHGADAFFARGGEARIEMGFRAGGMDSRACRANCRSRAARADRESSLRCTTATLCR